jgi:hypothetical protein
MERRQFYRAGPHMNVRIEAPGLPPLSGEIRNVSVQGLLVTCAAPLPRGTSCAVTISLGMRREAIRGRATVVREIADGMAMHLTSLDDPDSYRHLCNLVMYNAEDPDLVKREIQRWLRRGAAPGPRRGAGHRSPITARSAGLN